MTDGERTRGRTTKLWHGDTDGDAPTEAPVRTAPNAPPDDDDERTVLNPRAQERNARHATVLPDDHRSAFASHAPPRAARFRTDRREPALPGTREAPHDLTTTQPFPHPHHATLVSPPGTLPASSQAAPPPRAQPGTQPAPEAGRSSARARRVVMVPALSPIADTGPHAPLAPSPRTFHWQPMWKVAAAVCALALAFWGGTRWASRGAPASSSIASTHALARAPAAVAEPVPVTPVAVVVEPPAEVRLERAPTPQVVDGGVGSVALPAR